MSEQNDEFYRPILMEKKDLQIEGTDYNPDLNLLKEGNTIRVQLDNDVIIQRISHEIYSNYESGVRELINNEYRACRQARKLYNARPKVHVIVDKDNRTFSIEGIDSLGISVRIFDKVFRKLGVSGNVQGGDEIGMFGMGFASYTTLSEVITVETYAREDNQQFAFLGDRGIDFKILPKPDRDTYGTKITLTYKDGVIGDKIIDKVKDCARFSNVDTTISVIVSDDSIDSRDTDYYVTEEIECDVYNSGINWCRDQFVSLPLSDQKVSWYKEVHIDNDDMEFFGIIAFEKNPRYNNDKLVNHHYGSVNECSVNLVNTPIEMKFDTHLPFATYYLNIKNERKFMPTADRDRMKDESMVSLQEEFNKQLPTFFTDTIITSIDEYMTSLNKPMLEYIHSFRDAFSEEEYDRMNNVVNLLGHYFDTQNYRVRLRDMLKDGKQIIALKSLKGETIERLERHLVDVKGMDSSKLQFIRITPRTFSETRYTEMLELIQSVGGILGESYIKEHKVKTLGSSKNRSVSKQDSHSLNVPIRLWKPQSCYSLRTFGMEGYKNYYSTTIKELNDHASATNMIQTETAGEFDKYTGRLNRFYDCVIVKSNKKISSEIPTIKALKKKMNEKEYYTSKGKLKLKDIEEKKFGYDYHNTIVCSDKEKQKELSEILQQYELRNFYVFVDGSNEAFIMNVDHDIRGTDNELDNMISEMFNLGCHITDKYEKIPYIHKVCLALPKDVKEVYLKAIHDNDDSVKSFADILLNYVEKEV